MKIKTWAGMAVLILIALAIFATNNAREPAEGPGGSIDRIAAPGAIAGERKASADLQLQQKEPEKKIAPDLARQVEDVMAGGPAALSGADAETRKVRTLVRVGRDEDMQKAIEDIKRAGGEVAASYEIGNVIVADMPADAVEVVAGSSSVQSMWPERVYQALLEDSVSQINAESMWSAGYDGSGIKVAILDTGIDKNHPDLAGRVVAEADFVPAEYEQDGVNYGDGDDDNIAQDHHGHGTHVAGIIAANGRLKGVAPGAKLMAAKVLGPKGGLDSWIIAGIEWAVTNGADVISMSLGGPYSDLDSPILAAIKDATEAGVVVVVASGNCGPVCPGAACGGYHGVETPGISPEAITAGAVDGSGQWACFSSGGLVNNSFMKPDVVAPGVKINSTYLSGRYAEMTGTSMSAPHVAGAVALLLQANGNMTPANVKYVLESTARPLGEPGKDEKYGSGLIDVSRFIPEEINQLLMYRVSHPDTVYVRDVVDISFVPVVKDVLSAWADIAGPDNSTYTIAFYNTTTGLWRAHFHNTTGPGIYKMDISIKNSLEEVARISRGFSVIRYNLTKGYIDMLSIPAFVEYGAQMPIGVIFRNDGSEAIEAVVEVQIYRGGELEDTVISGMRNVTANSAQAFSLSWKAADGTGERSLTAIASYEGFHQTKERTFSITDSTPPLVKGISMEQSVIIGMPFAAEIAAYDATNLTGIARCSGPANYTSVLKESGSIGGNRTLYVTCADTRLPGEYSFTFEIRDSMGNRYVSSEPLHFSSVPCAGGKILVVSEHPMSGPERLSDALGSGYCNGIWDMQKSGLPSLDYLRGFDAVMWTAGNGVGDGVSREAADMLITYVRGGGRLLLEGAAIAERHNYDEFMQEVAHAELARGLQFAGNETGMSLSWGVSHPATSSLANPAEYDASKCRNPDAVSTVNGGVSLLDWPGANGSALVAYNSPYISGARTIFASFRLDALGGDSGQLIRDIAGWLTGTNTHADFMVSGIGHGYLYEGSPSGFTIAVGNLGAAPGSVEAGVMADGLPSASFNATLQANGSASRGISISLAEGSHNITVALNQRLAEQENDYLNNARTEEVYVHPRQADIAVESVSYSLSEGHANITALLSNLGGSYANAADVGIFIDGNLSSAHKVSIGPGENASVSAILDVTPGTYYIAALANPSMSIPESSYSNNYKQAVMYACNKSGILVVDDSDASNSSGIAGSAAAFVSALGRAGYCVALWNESEHGTPSAGYMNGFDAVMWSSGNRWGIVMDDDDISALLGYNGPLLIEGADVMFEHENDSEAGRLTGSELAGDMAVNGSQSLEMAQHFVTRDLAHMSINASGCPYPDGVHPIGRGYSIANWTNGSSAIVATDEWHSRSVYMAFSAEGVSDPVARDRLIVQSAEWLLEADMLDGDANGDWIVNIFDMAMVGVAFGSVHGQAGWNPDADRNRDGVINIFDLAIVGLNFGRSGTNPYPPACSSSWTCSGWSACSSGTQSRTCIDQNACGTPQGRPPESRPCNMTPAVYFRTSAADPDNYYSYRPDGVWLAVDADRDGLLEGFGSYSSSGASSGSCSLPADPKFIANGPGSLVIEFKDMADLTKIKVCQNKPMSGSDYAFLDSDDADALAAVLDLVPVEPYAGKGQELYL